MGIAYPEFGKEYTEKFLDINFPEMKNMCTKLVEFGTDSKGNKTYQVVLDPKGSGGGSGTSDYTQLNNKPSINGVALLGNKTTEELKIKAVDNSYILPSNILESNWNPTDSEFNSIIEAINSKKVLYIASGKLQLDPPYETSNVKVVAAAETEIGDKAKTIRLALSKSPNNTNGTIEVYEYAMESGVINRIVYSYNPLSESDIVNNLISNWTNKPLSALQGKTLKGLIDNLTNRVDGILGGITISLVETLPETGQNNIIYFVKKTTAFNDIYDEYMWLNNTWEKIGNTSIDLSNYYTKTEVESLIASSTGPKIHVILDESELTGITTAKTGDTAIIFNKVTNASGAFVDSKALVITNASSITRIPTIYYNTLKNCYFTIVQYTSSVDSNNHYAIMESDNIVNWKYVKDTTMTSVSINDTLAIDGSGKKRSLNTYEVEEYTNVDSTSEKMLQYIKKVVKYKGTYIISTDSSYANRNSICISKDGGYTWNSIQLESYISGLESLNNGLYVAMRGGKIAYSSDIATFEYTTISGVNFSDYIGSTSNGDIMLVQDSKNTIISFDSISKTKIGTKTFEVYSGSNVVLDKNESIMYITLADKSQNLVLFRTTNGVDYDEVINTSEFSYSIINDNIKVLNNTLIIPSTKSGSLDGSLRINEGIKTQGTITKRAVYILTGNTVIREDWVKVSV